jgi:hypothetical protein
VIKIKTELKTLVIILFGKQIIKKNHYCKMQSESETEKSQKLEAYRAKMEALKVAQAKLLAELDKINEAMVDESNAALHTLGPCYGMAIGDTLLKSLYDVEWLVRLHEECRVNAEAILESGIRDSFL